MFCFNLDLARSLLLIRLLRNRLGIRPSYTENMKEEVAIIHNQLIGQKSEISMGEKNEILNVDGLLLCVAGKRQDRNNYSNRRLKAYILLRSAFKLFLSNYFFSFGFNLYICV